MPKAYLRHATIEALAKEAAYREFPDATETGFGSDDIGWINAYQAARAEIVARHADGVAIAMGGFPGPGYVGLTNGLLFAVDSRDWYVDQSAASIEKVDAGALAILGRQ